MQDKEAVMRTQAITGRSAGSRFVLPALAGGLVVVVVLSAAVLGPLSAPGGKHGVPTSTRPVACSSTVHAVVLSGSGAVTVGYMPPGFRLKVGNPGDIGPGQSSRPLTYQKGNGAGRFPSGLTISTLPGDRPLGSDIIGRTNDKYSQTPVTIDGDAGLILTGSYTNPTVAVEWRATTNTTMSVVGFLVKTAQVLAVVRALRFHPPVVLALPLGPGRIITRGQALAASAPSGQPVVGAKLTSFTEVSALIQAERRTSSDLGEPADLANAPWKPLWAVLLAKASTNLVLVDAASGEVEWRTSAPASLGWFDALTDRDSSQPGCVGGTTARIPFGVLTRNEASYQPPLPPGAGAGADSTSTTQYKLVSVPALNREHAGEGCVQYCSLDTVLWVTVTVTKARRGTIVCPIPRLGDYPEPKVAEYTRFSFGDAAGISCTPPQAWYLSLTDLAPPLPT